AATKAKLGPISEDPPGGRCQEPGSDQAGGEDEQEGGGPDPGYDQQRQRQHPYHQQRESDRHGDTHLFDRPKAGRTLPSALLAGSFAHSSTLAPFRLVRRLLHPGGFDGVVAEKLLPLRVVAEPTEVAVDARLIAGDLG